MEKSRIRETSILYEILVYVEWFRENDNILKKLVSSRQTQSFSKSLLSYINLYKYFYLKKSQTAFDGKSLVLNDLPWKLAVNQDGKVVTILQETVLEIRIAKDCYSSVIVRAPFPSDHLPQFRRLTWSSDNNMLAIARDCGIVHIYTFLGCNVCTIQPKHSDGSDNPVIGLAFLSTKFKTTKWSYELIIIHLNGNVRSVLLSELDPSAVEDNIEFSLSAFHPKGISCVAYDATQHLLVVAGPQHEGEVGMSVWRILPDYPYLILSFDTDAEHRKRKGWSDYLYSYVYEKPVILTHHMKFSPNGQNLGCVHSNGDISFWSWPGLRLIRRWPLHKQPDYDRKPPGYDKIDKDERAFYPVNLDWWSDTEVVLVRKCGAVSVCPILTLVNGLGDNAEFLLGPPQVVAVHAYGNLRRPAILALECEATTLQHARRVSSTGNEARDSPGGSNILQTADTDGSEEDNDGSMFHASIQAALYSITDMDRFQPKMRAPKIIHRTYRLIGLKSVTPDELYIRNIDNNEFEDALFLAEKYNLDSDLVYQRQWRNNPVSIDTINNYLRKVTKVPWVVNECIQRVPDSAQAAHDLIKFGLDLTGGHLKNINPDKVTSDQIKLIICRVQLLSYLDNLNLYEKIIGSSKMYDAVEYGQLRQLPALNAAIKFARECKPDAVSILLTYCPNKTLPHWLPILSNFPETFRPTFYRFLLPSVMGKDVAKWETQNLRSTDWVEDEKFRKFYSISEDTDDFLYDENPDLREFYSVHLNVALVEKWYKMRAQEIESLTGLVENALDLIRAAREKYVQNLDILYFDLQTLADIVLNLDNSSVDLRKIQSLTHYEQAEMLMSDVNSKNFVQQFKKLLLPFAMRCEAADCHTKFILIKHLLLYYSKDGLEIALEFFTHLKNHSNCQIDFKMNDLLQISLECLYHCPLNNQLDNYSAILECLPAREDNLSSDEEQLHNRVDQLEWHLQVCDILEQCHIPKSLKFLKNNLDNRREAIKLMEAVAEYTRNNLLDFSLLLENLKLMRGVFQCVDEEFCYELTALNQMLCECDEIIESATDFLSTFSVDKGKQIPFEKSVELVLKAARTHFERSSYCDDHTLKSAQSCLRLIKETHVEICEELDLIEAVQLLYDFGVQILTIQVRMCSDRYSLIEKSLSARPDNYMIWQKIMQLAHALRIEGSDRLKREGQVLTMIAEYAFDVGDFEYCSEICGKLLNRNYAPSWSVVRKLAECLTFNNIAKKQILLAFCALNCPRDSLEEIIKTRINQRTPVFS